MKNASAPIWTAIGMPTMAALQRSENAPAEVFAREGDPAMGMRDAWGPLALDFAVKGVPRLHAEAGRSRGAKTTVERTAHRHRALWV